MILSLMMFINSINNINVDRNDIYRNIIFNSYKQEYLWKNLLYGLWCVWNLTKCKSNRFDCWWIIKNILYKLELLEKKNISKRNSRCIYESWKTKDIREVEAWDYIYFEAKTWVNHIAIASRDYDNWIWIYDNLKWEVLERFIKISWWNYYAWKYKIYVSEFTYRKKPKCKTKK